MSNSYLILSSKQLVSATVKQDVGFLHFIHNNLYINEVQNKTKSMKK